MIVLILFSLGSAALISGFISFGFYFIRPELAFAIFWITFGMLFVIMEPINRILRAKSLKAEGLNIDKAMKLSEIDSKQSVILECEYCREENSVKVTLEGENSFICKQCNNENNVVIRFSTARTSTPLRLKSDIDMADPIDDMADPIDEMGD